MLIYKGTWGRLDLQRFADGAGASGDGGAAAAGGQSAATGATPAAAGQNFHPNGTASLDSAGDPTTMADRLEALGVPKAKAAKYRAKKDAQAAAAQDNGTTAGSVATGVSDADAGQGTQQTAAENRAEDQAAGSPARMTWEEIMADPEYNRQMQSVVQSRLRSAKDAEDKLSQLDEALELLAARYGKDVSDLAGIASAVTSDRSYYEDRAVKEGIPVETAMKLDQLERAKARQDAEAAQQSRTQQLQQHFQSLQAQAAKLKKTFPGFDLMTELQNNKAFAAATSPVVGMSVEDAYWATHHGDLVPAAMQVTAQQVTEKVTNAVRSGSRPATENGTGSQAASTAQIDYTSKETRANIKKQMALAAAQGKKYYPDGTIRD